jgi:hypothetical protein
MDRNDMLRAARKLAADIVAEDGTDGDAQQRFLTEAFAQYESQLGAHELVDIFKVASGIDPKTGLRPDIGG